VDQAEQKQRLRLADGFRRSADGYSSERALRDALSRSYYSVFHLGCALLGRGYGNHAQFLKDLRERLGSNDQLCDKVERLEELRIQADYRFDAVKRLYDGDSQRFREEAFRGLALGLETYNELLERIAPGNDDDGSNRRSD
jgi:uncharacterized protein (UPF0332 family)